MVRVSDAYADAAGKYGLSADALSFGNGTVSVGGTPLDIAYIDDEGKAWTRQSTVDNAAEDYANRVGVTAPMDLAEKYMEMYLGDAQKLSNQLMHQKAFSYDPDSDPVYQAYQRKYRTEGARAGENAAAQYMALTGGLANSAAATARRTGQSILCTAAERYDPGTGKGRLCALCGPLSAKLEFAGSDGGYVQHGIPKRGCCQRKTEKERQRKHCLKYRTG